MNEQELDRMESAEWLESLDWVIKNRGEKRVLTLLRELQNRAALAGITLPFAANSPYVNTIPRSKQPAFPGNREIERRIKSIIRWNAMAMVVRANKKNEGIGGHISTYASAATLYEIAFNHFLKGREASEGQDMLYFQGHASPGMYARAFLEGRLTEKQLENFRRELQPEGGLSSYPHPWLMPNFWEFPTVSMGLGPMMAVYQARFNRYMEHRGMIEKSGRVWAFLGDGETDEPEALGSISLAGREGLDNLIFVINTNLQRLDGPVRGNGKVIQELESTFRGAGWNVIKVIWGGDWDPLLERDQDGVLVKRMEDAVDGDYQKYSVEGGEYIREHFFGTDDRLKDLVSHLSDDELHKLRRGGHDPEKVFAAYQQAVNSDSGKPTVILAKTIKGYGMGESGEGKNITHQQKKLNEDELRDFRTRFGIPISDEDVGKAPFYKPPEDSREMQYLHERRNELGGYLPGRVMMNERSIPEIPSGIFKEFHESSGDRTASTTMIAVRLLGQLMKDKQLGPRMVPIVPDEARTFGMEALFRQVGIYASTGQKYDPVDSDTLLYYKEAKDGQILEEGITEAGSISSFIAAGTSYVTHGVPMIPFFLFYSMFGFQRISDFIWAAGDMRARGFLIGGTAGRTTLNGEGLQHQDGQSHILALSHPNIIAYDPAYSYEAAVIIEDGMRRMYERDESLMIYMTAYNEAYKMPAMPADSTREGIIRGMYLFRGTRLDDARANAKILGSGTILNQAIQAAEILESEYYISVNLFSVTSYKKLYLDGVECDRYNMLHPEEKAKKPWITDQLEISDGVTVAATDYLKALPLLASKWAPGGIHALGTDGFGRSDTREDLRDFFEIDYRYIVVAALHELVRTEKISMDVLKEAMERFQIDVDRTNPAIS